MCCYSSQTQGVMDNKVSLAPTFVQTLWNSSIRSYQNSHYDDQNYLY